MNFDALYSNPLLWCLLIWVLIGLIAALKSRGTTRRSVGLTVAFVINMALNHWFGALVCLLPWYSPSGNDNVVEGFELSTLGMIGFAIGCFALAPLASPSLHDEEEPADASCWNPRILRTYGLVGAGCFLAMAAGANRLPSVAAVFSAGFNFVLVALCLAIWCASQRGDRRRVHGWLAAAFVLPFFTMMTQGFLGYGVGYLIVVFSFYLLLTRHRLALLLLMLPLAYVGLSFYVSYMRDREEIREVVWGGEAYRSRVDRIWQTCRTMEWFDPLNAQHLERVDRRLNQNRLVGVAALHLQNTHSFANGDTLWMALLALIPRAVWADKPAYGGSMDLVSKYTGIRFAEGTSVGMGVIFEPYVNFGRLGVFLTLLLIGAVVGVIDHKSALALHTGQPLTFGRWFLMGIIMMNVLGSFAEITASLAGALIVAFAVNHYLKTHLDVEPTEAIAQDAVDPLQL